MFDLISKANEAKKRMAEVKAKLETVEVAVQSQEELVTVIATGAKNIKSIKLNPSIFSKPLDQVESLITGTINNALSQVEVLAKEEMRKATDGLLPNIPGLDLFK
jgi:nucleoid-associated protein EbfC